jgi:hypothetical protein
MRLLVAASAALLLWAGAAAAQIGSGSRHYDTSFDGVTFRVFTYRPSCSRPNILFAFHGTNRNADVYRDNAKRIADQQCLVVIAPRFEQIRFTNAEYQRGGIVDDRNRLQDRSNWTTRFVRHMIPWARQQVGGSPQVYLYGHSAGAQFLSRVAAFERIPGIARYVVANPSTHVLPSLTEAVPYGFDLLGSNTVKRAALREYLALPLTIYLGELDNDPNAADLSTNAAAMRQGAHRFERGQTTFAMGRRIARDNGWTFNWRLSVAPGVAHSNSGMLRSSAAKQAFGF